MSAWDSIYAIPPNQRKGSAWPGKKKARRPDAYQRKLIEIKSLKTQNKKIRASNQRKDETIHKLRSLSQKKNPDCTRCIGYRSHIKNLHATLERERDPSISKRARSRLRKSIAEIRDIPDLKLKDAEKVFVQRAIEQNYEVYRSGWPDFLIVKKGTDIYRFVEVKSPSDAVSRGQIEMFAALERIGIEVEVFRVGKPLGRECTSWRVAAGLSEHGSGNVTARSRNNQGAVARSTDQIPTNEAQTRKQVGDSSSLH